MLNHEHPTDERLSALASHDPDESNDGTLTAHVASCDRCAAVTSELSELRSALADMPDLQPPRPLQLVPAVEPESSDDAAGGWVRRLFGPAMAAGAVLALVGTIGTAAPALDGISSGAAPGAAENAETEQAAAEAQGGAAATVAGAPESTSDRGVAATDGTTLAAPGASGVAQDESSSALTMEAERSPWPMVLFAGVALMFGAVLLRWILAPRAG